MTMSDKTIGNRLAGALLLAATSMALAACVSTTTGPPETEPVGADAASEYYQLGMRYFEAGNFDLARDRLVLSTEIDPKRPEVWSALALTYEQLGNLRLAEESHNRALRTGSRSFDVQNAYAIFLCRQGRFEDAERQFERSIKAPTNDNPEVMMTNAGVCFMNKPDMAKAESYFRRALERRPTHGEALLQMSLLKHGTGDNLRARAFLQRYRSLYASDAGVLYLCILIEEQLGDEQARSDCRNDLLRGYPQSPEAQQLLRSS